MDLVPATSSFDMAAYPGSRNHHQPSASGPHHTMPIPEPYRTSVDPGVASVGTPYGFPLVSSGRPTADLPGSPAIIARVAPSASLPLPSMSSATMARSPENRDPTPCSRRTGDLSAITDCLRARGYFWERNWTHPEIVRLAATLGRPSGDIGDPRIVRALAPQPSHEVNANTLSRRYGLGPFPFHTETAYWSRPARYVVLHCMAPGSGERPTLLVDSRQWQISAQDRRRFLNAACRVNGQRSFLASLATLDGHDLQLRFDRACMSPATSDAAPAMERMSTFIEDSTPVEIRWAPRTLLVFDNYRCLHARGPASTTDTDRVLHRILVDG